MSPEKRLTVLFGSQTFTAQEIAEHAWRQSKGLGFSGPVQALDEYPIHMLIHESLVLFVCSTTGQGDEPDNMKKFWKFLLRRNLPSNSLQRLKFGVLALGDSSYAKFNFAGKKLHKRLIQLGATPLLDIGLCDYQHDLGHDAVLSPWLDRLWTKLKDFYPEIDPNETAKHSFIPRWKVSISKTSEGDRFLNGLTNGLREDIYFSRRKESLIMDPKELELVTNTRTTSEDHFQNVRLLNFKMTDESLFNYKPGDVFNLRPRNSKQDIYELFDIFRSHSMDIEPHYRLLVEKYHEDMPVPEFLREPLTLYEIAEQYWDLNCIPNKYVFSLLAAVSKHELEREKCKELCTPEGQEDLLNYCRRPRRTILEVLQDFHRSTSKLTIDIIFELFSPIKPRSYSIASSAKNDGTSLELLVAVVHYYSKLKKPRMGLCSNWLKNLKPGDRIYGWIKSGTLVFPEDPGVPCVLVGPGTGLAPLRSLLLEREAAGTARAEVLALFFGCRREGADMHCSALLRRWSRERKVTVVCAFSRDQEAKVYVQHKIAEHRQLVWELIKRKGSIFICGSSKNMPESVKEAFVRDVFVGAGGMETTAAENLLNEMESNGQLQMETW